jgi:hypothetical protein
MVNTERNAAQKRSQDQPFDQPFYLTPFTLLFRAQSIFDHVVIRPTYHFERAILRQESRRHSTQGAAPIEQKGQPKRGDI